MSPAAPAGAAGERGAPSGSVGPAGSSGRTERARRARTLDALERTALATGALAAAVVLAGGTGTWAELAGNLRWQVALLLAAAAGLAALRRRFAVTAAGLLLAGWHGAPWMVLLAAPTRAAAGRAPPSAGGDVVLATLNVNYETEDFRALEAWLRTTAADVVAATEVSRACREVLESCAARFPHRLYAPFPAGEVEVYTQALLSRLPVLEHDLDAPRPADPRAPADAPIVGPRYGAVLDAGGRRLTVVLAHAPRPLGPARHRFRVAQFDALSERPWPPSAVLVGDLNATAGSPLLAELLARTGLADSRLGRGRQPTWVPARALSAWPRWLTAAVALDLDHVLVGPGVTVLARGIGPDVGSDHRPVECRVALRP